MERLLARIPAKIPSVDILRTARSVVPVVLVFPLDLLKPKGQVLGRPSFACRRSRGHGGYDRVVQPDREHRQTSAVLGLGNHYHNFAEGPPLGIEQTQACTCFVDEFGNRDVIEIDASPNPPNGRWVSRCRN